MRLSPFIQVQVPAVESFVIVEPIYNVLLAMSLLSSDSLNAEEEPWLAEKAANLTSNQKQTNQIIFEWFGSVLLPRANHQSFPNLYTALASESPIELRERILQVWIDQSDDSSITSRSLLADEKQFEAFAKAIAPRVDHSEVSGVYQLISNPAVLQDQIVSHLRTLWETEFKAEWKKKVSMMHYCAEELNARSWPTDSAINVLQAFIRKAVPDEITHQLTGVRQINIVPSPFIQMQARRLDSPDTLWLFLFADFWLLPMRTEPIKRSEVKGIASALSDDTRLQILELLAANGELRAQEIIARLNASQSTVSRHLKQLNSAQFISEKRAGDANKIYQLNPSRVSEFAHLLSTLISTENAQTVLNDARLDQPEALRPYLDRDGLVTQWPAKWTTQKMVLDYLVIQFSVDTKYKETEINEVLNQWHTYDDPVYLRRALVDSGLLGRTSDGRQYWKIDD